MLLFCVNCLADTTSNNQAQLHGDAEKQLQQLIDQYGVTSHQPWQHKCDQLIEQLELNHFKRCVILAATHPNAYSMANGVVVVTEGLLNQINNDEQLAHVLAHEHAHLAMNHHTQAQQLVNNPPTFFTKSRIKKFYRKIEQEADQAADQWLLQFNMDPLQIHHYLIRIEANTEEHSNDHQKLKDRIKRKGLPTEIIDPWWQAQSKRDPLPFKPSLRGTQ